MLAHVDTLSLKGDIKDVERRHRRKQMNREQLIDYYGQKIVEYKEAVELFKAIGDNHIAELHKEILNNYITRYLALRYAQ